MSKQAIDARNADGIFQLLGELNAARGTAFLVVTHDLQLAKRMRRQLEMRDGRLNAELTLMGAGNGFTVIVTRGYALAAVVAGQDGIPYLRDLHHRYRPGRGGVDRGLKRHERL